MKLEMTLPERPGLLHAVPVLNIFALLWLLYLLAPSLFRQSGVAVELPPSRFQLDRYQDSLVVTLGKGDPEPVIHLGRDPVTPAELAARLEKLRNEGAPASTIVLMRTDAGTPVGTERRIAELILGHGFRLALVAADSAGQRPDALNPASR